MGFIHFCNRPRSYVTGYPGCAVPYGVCLSERLRDAYPASGGVVFPYCGGLVRMSQPRSFNPFVENLSKVLFRVPSWVDDPDASDCSIRNA